MLSPLSRGIKIEGMLMLSCICDIVIILMFHIRKVTLYVYSFICGCLLLKRSIYGRKSCLLLCFKICSFSLTFSHNFTCWQQTKLYFIQEKKQWIQITFSMSLLLVIFLLFYISVWQFKRLFETSSFNIYRYMYLPKLLLLNIFVLFSTE